MNIYTILWKDACIEKLIKCQKKALSWNRTPVHILVKDKGELKCFFWISSKKKNFGLLFLKYQNKY